MRILLLLVLSIGCGETVATQGTSNTAGENVQRPAPLPAVVRLLGGANVDAELPLVVALHGRGSDPDRFARFFEGATEQARLLLVEAPIDEGNGRAWFSFRGKGRAELATEMRGLAQRVLQSTRDAIRNHPTRGRPIVTGFSQGAMLVYILALEHPGTFRVAVPVSGVLFESFIPNDAAGATPLVVLHGEADPVISFSGGTENLPMLRSRGAEVELLRFPEARHWIAGDMKTSLHEVLGIADPPG